MINAPKTVLGLALLACALPFSVQAASPVASVTASRTSGKVPLMVFFDATATTDADTSKPIHHLTYCFDAGDGSTETYSLAGHKTTSKSKFCGGPIWAYVYETTGTHTMTLTVIDEQGNTNTTTVNITPSDYAGSDTTCISTSGTFTGCPSGSEQHTSSDFDASITTECLATNSDTRCLFRAGESFAASKKVTINTQAVHIGSYGTGGVGDGKYTVTGAPTVLFDPDEDVRITDGSWTASGASVFVDYRSENGTSDPTNVLVQNWNTTATQRFIDGGVNNQTDGSVIPSYLGVFTTNGQDCGNSGDNCVFTSVRYLALVDMKLQDATDGEHIVRLQHGENTFIHNVKLSDAKSAKHLLTVRALPWAGSVGGISNRWAENVFISDSWFVGNTDIAIETTSAANTSSDQPHHRNHIWERNYHTTSGAVAVNQFYQITSSGGVANDITLRNNLFDMTGTETFGQALNGNVFGIEVYNNSMYSPNNSREFWANAGNCLAKNNLAWDSTGSQLFYQNSACGTSSNNWDANGGETGVADLSSCPFATCPPGNVSDFAIKSTDPDNLIDGGASVPLACDFDSTDRSQGLTVDVGALEQGTTSLVCAAVSTEGQYPPPNNRVINVVP